MKKRYIYLFICMFLYLATACSAQGNIPEKIISESSSEYSSNQDIIASDQHYRIYKGNLTKVSYEIYDSQGKIVLSETTDRPLEIAMLNEEIVDISIGMGTGITEHKYYSAERNVISENFSYILANQNELIAYIEIPEKQPLENRKVVVRNVFDKELFYKEYELDFSRVDTPVLDASFSEDGTSLQLTYLSGNDQIEISKTLSIE